MRYGCCFSGEFLFWDWQEEEENRRQKQQQRQQETTYLGMQNNLSNYISKYIYGNNNHSNRSRTLFSTSQAGDSFSKYIYDNNNDYDSGNSNGNSNEPTRTKPLFLTSSARETASKYIYDNHNHNSYEPTRTKSLFSTSPKRFEKKRPAKNHSTILHREKKEKPTVPEPIVPELIYLNRTSNRFPQYYCDFSEDDVSRSSSTNEVRDSITPLERRRQITSISDAQRNCLNQENPDNFKQNDSCEQVLSRGERIIIQRGEEDSIHEKYDASYKTSSYDNDINVDNYSIEENDNYSIEEKAVIEKYNSSHIAPTYDIATVKHSAANDEDDNFLNEIEGKSTVWSWIMKPPTRKKLETIFRQIDEESTGTILKMKLNTAVLMMYPSYNLLDTSCQSNENTPIAFRTAYKSCCSTTNSSSISNDDSPNEIVDRQEFAFFIYYLVYYHNLSHYFCFAVKNNNNSFSAGAESIPTITRENFQKAVLDMGFLKFIEKEDMIHDFFDMIDIHDEGVIQLEYICNYLAFHSSFTKFVIDNDEDDAVVAISDYDVGGAVMSFPTFDYDAVM